MRYEKIGSKSKEEWLRVKERRTMRLERKREGKGGGKGRKRWSFGDKDRWMECIGKRGGLERERHVCVCVCVCIHTYI